MPFANSRTIKVALIGCGQISEAHLSEISLIPDAEVVAVCDLNALFAEDTAERFGVKRWFSDYKEMIRETQPQVVHITTPPQTHLQLGLDLIQNGCHLYIEKPFGVDYNDAKQLIDKARMAGVMVCCGFFQLFDEVFLRFQKRYGWESLGEIVHIESYYGTSLDDNYSKLFLKNPNHWVHRLPGKFFQNVISHPLYHMIPLFPGTVKDIVCFAQDRSENGVFQDELRVLMQAGKTTGCMTFTSAVRPVIQCLKIYGTKSIVQFDLANHAFFFTNAGELPGLFGRVRNSVVSGLRLVKEGAYHFITSMNGKDRYFAGMGNLFQQFYNDIRSQKMEPPVPYTVLLNTAVVMDEIAAQCQKIEKNKKVEA